MDGLWAVDGRALDYLRLKLIEMTDRVICEETVRLVVNHKLSFMPAQRNMAP